MRRMPPQDDEQPEGSQINNPSAQRQSTKGRKKVYYFTDEQPHIPKVRRASLYNDPTQAGVIDTTKRPRVSPAAPESGRRPRTERSLPDTEKSARIEVPLADTGRRARVDAPLTDTGRRARVDAPLTDTGRHTKIERTASDTTKRLKIEKSAQEDEDLDVPTYSTSKIMVAQRRRSPVYEPPPLAQHNARGYQKRQQQALIFRIQQLRHNRSFLLAGSIMIVMLVLVPIISSIAHNPGSQRTNGRTTPHAPIAPIVASNPHELIITPPNSDHPSPPIYANAAYLLDADTGATLYASNPFTHLPMLSTTKLMTSLLAVEQGNLDQNVTVTDAMGKDINQLSADSAVINVHAGETYTLRDLLYGLLLVSGNDAAVVIADTIGGNLPAFVSKMNERALQLGLHDTHYLNPHGLLMTGQYSSAHDLAILGQYALDNPLIHEISSTKVYHVPQGAGHPEHYFTNGNQFLWWYPGVDGGKTGWDAASNFIQIISCVRNKHHLIGVTMHTNDWWTDMRDLMNWGFNSFDWVSPHDADANNPPIPFDHDWNYFARDKKENTVPAANQGRYYILTGYSISGFIMDFFDKNDGLNKFGFPTGQSKAINDTTLNQRFEHGTIQCDLKTKQCKIL